MRNPGHRQDDHITFNRQRLFFTGGKTQLVCYSLIMLADPVKEQNNQRQENQHRPHLRELGQEEHDRNHEANQRPCCINSQLTGPALRLLPDPLDHHPGLRQGKRDKYPDRI
ncbi:hypothetical protein D3C75_387080 [compost metagenome]